MFYVLEGSDGSGKTSVGKRISEISAINYVETPSENFRKTNSSPKNKGFEEAFDYFMRGNLFTIEELDMGRKNLVGRYCISTIIANSLMYGKDISDVEKMAVQYSPEEPTKTFLLVVDEDEQVRRILDRNNGKHGANDRNMLSNPLYRKQMNDYYLEVAREKDWTIIDTTLWSVDDVAKEILSQVNCNICDKLAERSFKSPAITRRK